MGHIESEDQTFELKEVCDETPEGLAVFLSDLKDPTEPEKHDRAWKRMWGQVKLWARDLVKGSGLYGGVAEEIIINLAARASEELFKIIHKFIQLKDHPAYSFCSWAKECVRRIWTKMTVKYNKDQEKLAKYRERLEITQADNNSGLGGSLDDVFMCLAAFGKTSQLAAKKASIMRKYLVIKTGNPDITETAAAKLLLISRKTLLFYYKDFVAFAEKGGYL